MPSWSRDTKIGNRLINARVETLAEKPSWRSAFRKHRAIVPARGYYEWSPRDYDGMVRKQPFYLHPATMAFWLSLASTSCGGITSKADDGPDRWLWSAVIITTDATGPSGEIHDRTPLILPYDRVDAWLDPNRTEPDAVYEVLDGIVMQPLAVRPVSTQVNKVGNDGPELLKPLD